MMMHMTGELSVQGYTMLQIHSELQNGHNEWADGVFIAVVIVMHSSWTKQCYAAH